jgi:hypothetical protein
MGHGKRWVIAGMSAVAVIFAGVVGFAAAGGFTPGRASSATSTTTEVESAQHVIARMASMRDDTLDMDAVHDSPTMQEMHDALPADLAARCDAMHEQMAAMHGQTEAALMMGAGMTQDGAAAQDGGAGGGMMGAGMSLDAMKAHHPGWTGG